MKPTYLHSSCCKAICSIINSLFALRTKWFPSSHLHWQVALELGKAGIVRSCFNNSINLGLTGQRVRPSLIREDSKVPHAQRLPRVWCSSIWALQCVLQPMMNSSLTPPPLISPLAPPLEYAHCEAGLFLAAEFPVPRIACSKLYRCTKFCRFI